MRQKDLHILTSSLHTNTNDRRISAVHTTVRSPAGSNPANSTTKTSFPAGRQRNGTDVWDDEEGVWSEWTLVRNVYYVTYHL